MANDGKTEEDLISSLTDAILQQILGFIRTKLAITTSVLSKRWRHVWCYTPSLSLDTDNYKRGRPVWCVPSINKTLTLYAAPNIMNFNLKTSTDQNVPYRDKWIEFALSRKVENLSLDFWKPGSDKNYKFPDFFYTSSSLKQLTLMLSFCRTLFPICPVSWTSLKKLYLSGCNLSDETMAKILYGCPILESLTLHYCDELLVLDLSKSLRLRTLQVKRNVWVPGPTQIIAPHIHFLRLENSQLPCTFVDVATLTEAKLDICYVSMYSTLEADILQVMVLKMLDKLHNVEKLTFGGNFLQILSLAELRGVPFPMLNVKALTLETVIFQYVIPGIERLLRNSPDLEKITIRAINCNTIPEQQLDKYLQSQGLDTDQCWRSKDGVFWNYSRWTVELEYMVSFVELMLKNTKKLAKMVVLLNERYLNFKFESLVQRLSHYNNVVIALTHKLSTDTEKDWGFIEIMS